MDGQLRKIAAGHARSYGNYKAYLRGYGEGSAAAGRPGDSERARIRAGWVSAVEAVRRRLEETDPEKGEVFVRLFDLDGVGRNSQSRVIRLAMDLHTSPANIYRWRENILDQLILAATQQGLLRPFDTAEGEDCAQ